MHVNCSVCFGTTESCLESEPSGVEGERLVYPTMELCSVAQLSPTVSPSYKIRDAVSIQSACAHPYNFRALDFLRRRHPPA